MIFYAAYTFFALISMLVFVYSSFGLGAANVLVLLGASFLVSKSIYPNSLIKAVMLFTFSFIMLSFIEISLGSVRGTGFGSGFGGAPYVPYMVSGEYTEAGSFRAAKFVALGTLIFLVGELFRLGGIWRSKN